MYLLVNGIAALNGGTFLFTDTTRKESIMKKRTKTGALEDLTLAIFDHYLRTHGGAQENPYPVLCWMSGRVDDLTKFFNEKDIRAEERA